MSINPTPTVSVLMPVYNLEKYVGEAIESILNQTFEDFEFIIINDGSTDSTEQIVLSYQDPRIRYIRNEENLKIVKTLNRGLNLANGKYIARMDGDDISHPQRLERQVNFMEQSPQVGVCGARMSVLNRPKLKYFEYYHSHEEIMWDFLNRNALGHPCVMIRTNILWEHHIKYDENYALAEDYKMWIDLIPYTKFANLQEHLLWYRLHNAQSGAVSSVMQEKVVGNIKKHLRSWWFLYYYARAVVEAKAFTKTKNIFGLIMKIILQKCKMRYRK